MKKKYLHTTLLTRFPNEKNDFALLGEWCLSTEELFFTSVKSEIINYHWEDRNVLYNDFLELQKVYNNLLIDLSKSLNSLHNVKHDTRYWHIICGPWLFYFTQLLFDRWKMIKIAIDKNSVTNAIFFDLQHDEFVPNCFNDFRQLHWDNNWNQALYQRIIKSWTSLNIEYNNDKLIRKKNKKTTSKKISILKWLNNLIFKISGKNDNYYFSSTYLSLKNEILLQLKLNQLPKYNIESPIKEYTYDSYLRSKVDLYANNFDNFENCLRVLIPEFIPKAYIEGYNDIISTIKKANFPVKPKLIFTSTSHYIDENFKFWAAQKTEDGSKLVLCQHGGNIGSAKWSTSETFENQICDIYFSWGWLDQFNKNIPFGIIKAPKRNNKPINNNGNLLIISSVMPKFSYCLGSYTISVKQTKKNLTDQVDFINNLNLRIKNKISIRLFNPDWNWDQKKLWESLIPSIHIDNGNLPIMKAFNLAKLVIVTYNATTYLETLSQNIPTIIFWDRTCWELREEAEIHFKKLENAGILHYSSISASKKVESVWENINEWWYSNEIQNTINEFCYIYARTYEKPITQLYNKIIKI